MLTIKIEDAFGAGKIFTRLLEVVSEGIGEVFHPYLVRKNADAKAYEIRTMSAAMKEVAEQHHLPVIYKDGSIELWQKPEDKTLRLNAAPIEERLSLRLDYQERKRQHNIENITSFAASNFTREEEVPNEKPDEDWVSRFFSSAQDISSEEMQVLWGRILAGEIKKPGSYSLKTLDVIRNITKSDAATFEKIGKFALDTGALAFIAMQDKKWLKENHGIGPHYLFDVAELGAMYPTELSLDLFRDGDMHDMHFTSGELILLIKRGQIKNMFKLPIWKFTPVGRELLALIPPVSNEAYLESLGQYFLHKEALAALGKIKNRLSNGQIEYDVIREIQLPSNTNEAPAEAK